MKNIWQNAICIFCCICLLISCGPQIPADIQLAMDDLPSKIDYNVHVKPILSDKCFACHGPDAKKQKAGLRLDEAESAFASLRESKGKVAIKPGSLRNSEVYWRITSSDPKYLMPSPESHLSLSAYEKAVLIKWIDDGAQYKQHWAFTKPALTDLPKVKNTNWPKNKIDYFILNKIEENNLNPSPQASKEILLRRATFDLSGLPPSIAEIDAFLADNSEKAFEKVVDRLLNSPHYGERMAVDWLDLARFADSHGYTVDRLRDMTPYRDWVIKAFNQNMPYDKFVHWQLAGDLMPNPTKEMNIATAFNRNHQQNMEGGIVEEEFQTEYVMDRTNTFGDAFLGLSVGCAKCHDHKYDPISQKNYYQLSSFFNNIREAGQISWDDALPTPTLMLPTQKQQEMLAFLNKNIATEGTKLSQIKQQAGPPFELWLTQQKYKKLSSETEPKTGLLAQFGFEKAPTKNEVTGKEAAFMNSPAHIHEKPVLATGKFGKSIILNGDSWFELDQIGVFRKSDSFTVGLWLNIPESMKEGVIFHKCIAERLYNFKGFYLYIRKDGSLEASLAHTAPSNAITKISQVKVPKGKWIQLTMTYSGTGTATGLQVYLDGSPLKMNTEVDQLTKDILFNNQKYGQQTSLQFGAWERGSGLKNAQMDEIVVYNRKLSSFEIGILAKQKNWASFANKPSNSLTVGEKAALNEYFLEAEFDKIQLQKKEIQKQKNILADSAEHIQEIMVMQEMPHPKPTFVLQRGNYATPAERVYANTPEKIFPFPQNLPKNRYGLAQWLTHKDHPLTARVVVNRLWQNLFGIGLVKTVEDFGNQGEMPSHLELLDYLAVEFVESGWDVKKLMKLMVLSATYSQDSKPIPHKVKIDAENRLLARGPSQRLTAEMIRDNALFASNLMKKTIGGKSIKPYQPEALWEINNTTYVPDTSSDVYKRSLYMLIKRSVPHPTLGTFDAGSRSYCMVRRQKTNTPLQALVIQNDPTFLECSKVLAEQMYQQNDLKNAIITTYQKLTGIKPTASEIDLLVNFREKELIKFKQNLQKTKGILSAGFYKNNAKYDAATLAANAMVANLIMNSDACITKR